MARKVKDAYDRLPPEEQAVAAIYGHNYGEAGAVDYFGRAWGLPRAVGGHNASLHVGTAERRARARAHRGR